MVLVFFYYRKVNNVVTKTSPPKSTLNKKKNNETVYKPFSQREDYLNYLTRNINIKKKTEKVRG